MNSLLFSLLLSAFTSSAFADFNGQWMGEVIATSPEGFQIPCSMKAKIKQTKTMFDIQNLETHCGFFDRQWQKITLKIKGEQLWLKGGSFGTLKGDLVQALNYPGVVLDNGQIIRTRDYRQDFRLEVKEGKLLYLERWIDAEDKQTYFTIQGELSQ